MRTSDSPSHDSRRIGAAGLGGIILIVAAAVFAYVFNEGKWLALAAVGGGIVAGALYIGYRQRHGPLDWDQHLGERTESNFHHL
jgi:hypothetical protein